MRYVVYGAGAVGGVVGGHLHLAGLPVTLVARGQSLVRGTGDSEIDFLGGEIVLQGRLHGVPTPVNEAIVAATRRLAYDGGAPRSLDAAEVLARL